MEKPMSVEQIVQRAGTSDFDDGYTLQQWFRTGKVMLKQASIYEHEGNDQEAYSLLYRYSRLVLDDLHKHPDAKNPQHRAAWTEARRELNRSLAKLELLKPRINKRYDVYQQRLQARQAKRRAYAAKSAVENAHAPHTDESDLLDEASARVDPVEHRDIAVRFANQEIKRRIRGEPSGTAASLDGEWRTLHTRMKDMQRNLNKQSSSDLQFRAPTNNSLRSASPAIDYPSVPHATKHDTHHFTSSPPPLPLTLSSPHRPPKIPALPPKHTETPHEPSTPAIPSKLPLPDDAVPEPVAPQFAHASQLENGTALRTIFLPTQLRHSFLRLADSNTRNNLETMGLLCGTLIRNALFISKLVIPAQTATSDTCEMLDEESLLAYIEEQPEGLWTLGWIHTHPSQTCFLSSRDLHTHMGYQRTLLEAIAIVCSPRHSPDWGVFRLTDPPGMQAISRCNRPGLFHPHDVDCLYTDVLGRPGHVIEHAGLEFEVVDLRKK